MSQRHTRFILVMAGIIMPVLVALFVSQPAAAVDYYPSYTLSPSQTDRNMEIAFILAAAGLLILAVDSLLFLAHYLWSRRPAARQARRQSWSQERS